MAPSVPLGHLASFHLRPRIIRLTDAGDSPVISHISRCVNSKEAYSRFTFSAVSRGVMSSVPSIALIARLQFR